MKQLNATPVKQLNATPVKQLSATPVKQLSETPVKNLSATPLNSIRQGETWQRPNYASVKHTARAKREYYFHREG